MKHILKTSPSIICLIILSCKDQPKNTEAGASPSSTPATAAASTASTPKENSTFNVTSARYEESLAVKTNVGDLNLANLDTKYPFVVVELSLKTDEMSFKSSEVNLEGSDGMQYKLEGYAPFAIEHYKPLPPEKKTIFDVFPLNQKDASGSTIHGNWSREGKGIDFTAKGKGAKIILTFAAPKADGDYKLMIPGSDPVAFKPETQAK
jgi:hypothetical protein